MFPATITGLGLCTPLGETAPSTWDALLAGRFITDHSQAAGHFDEPRVHNLARRAAEEAIAQADWTIDQLTSAALVVGTSKGPIEQWLSGPYDRLHLGLADVAASFSHPLTPSPSHPLILTQGPRLTIATACASGLHALIRGVMLLSEGVDRVLVVAAESSLQEIFLGSFKRLGVLAPPETGCRPFDESRRGFLMSEASAAVCLERKQGGIHVENFATAADATSMTGSDPDGRMTKYLLEKILAGRTIDLIQAHATGTKANDETELAAIQSALNSLPLSPPHPFTPSPPRRPLIYSHKSAIGHTLGAAGLISVVLNCLCHQTNLVPGNVRTANPIPMHNLHFSRIPTERPIRRSVAISAGFGGAGAAVTLADYKQ